MTHTRIHHLAGTILAIALAVALSLAPTTTTPASARTFNLNSTGSMVQRPLPADWACILQRATSNSHSLRCQDPSAH